MALKLSPQFAYGTSVIAQPVVAWTAVQVLAGACYVYGASQVRRAASNWTPLAVIVITGTVMRVLMWLSTPVLETDFYRYLWDGAMLANGHDPYVLSPAAIQAGGGAIPEAVSRLAAASQPVLDRINHPLVTTIYPPAAVMAFGLAYFIDPWSIEALRGVYLLFDLVTAFLLACLLKRHGHSPLWLFVYWCNPLLVRFTYNSLHMDIIVVCLVALLLLGIARRENATSAAALSVAIGVKIWPALLTIHLWAREKMPRAALAGLALGVVLLSFMLPAFLHADSGLLAYAGTWEINDPVFRFVSLATGLVAGNDATASLLARTTSAVLLVAWLAYLYRADPAQVNSNDVLIMVLGGFLILQPAPYPWYFLWLLPLLAARPVTAWIVLTATLPLYDLRFFFEPRDMAAWFDYIVGPVEFSPLLLLLSRDKTCVS